MKLLKHERDKIGDFQRRVLLHIPIGFIIGLASVVPFVGSTLAQLFIRYEENEDVHTRDEAWKDYFGALTGFVLAVVIIIGLLVWLVTKFIGVVP